MENTNSADKGQEDSDAGSKGLQAPSFSSHFSDTDNNSKMDNKSSARSFFLRPSPLQHHVNLIKEPDLPAPTHSNPFKLDPPKLMCPLTEKKGFPMESSKIKEGEVGQEDREVGSSQQTSPTSESAVTCNGTSGGANHKKDDGAARGGTTCSENGTTAASSSAGAAKTSGGGFVFGSNLASRALIGQNQGEKTAEEATDAAPMSTFETATTSLVTSFADSAPSLSLEESAAMEQSKDLKLELKEVKMQTGEEGESNVLQVFAKLHVFDKVNQAWLERGRGLVRLNDMPAHTSFQSRLVMRAQGSLRVIMNMKLWAGMLVERVAKKNLKVSAIDPSEGLMVYLITASISDIALMYEAIHLRSVQMEEGAKKRPHSPQPTQALSPQSKKSRLEDRCSESNEDEVPSSLPPSLNTACTPPPAEPSSPSAQV